MKRVALFSKTRELESQIDEFCDKVDQGAMTFKFGINSYINDDYAAFEEKLTQINQLESQGDSLRRNVERRLYEQTLIPESRGDVLGLLENMDSILNKCEGAMWQFAIEKPHIPEEFRADYVLNIHAIQWFYAKVSITRPGSEGGETSAAAPAFFIVGR